ncbi:hypothetical protein [Amycolatopsis minnesotensis]|uniref:Uncharacterized protein n=1 Tax=Amycolatopsis minnesotensis TaxID=337894 RepID=A0ABN2R6A8_9PSEU
MAREFAFSVENARPIELAPRDALHGFADEAVAVLRRAGWKVSLNPVGHAAMRPVAPPPPPPPAQP